MATVTLEVEVPSQFSADKAFKIFCNFDKIAPKVIPDVFKAIDTLEGKGDVETVKIFTFGDAIPFTSGKYKVDSIDASNYSYNYSLIEGDNLMGIADSVNHHVKIVPSSNGGSAYKHTVVYNCKGDEKPPQEVLNTEKQTYENAYKAVEAYVVEHPEAIN